MEQASSQAVTLDKQGQNLLELLVEKLPGIKSNSPATFISYKQVHDELNLPLHGRTFGESLQQQGLNSLADWTAESGKPGITGLIINQETHTPGNGYFKIHKRKTDDIQWWLNEIQKSKDFDWTPYLPTNEKQSNSASGEEWSEEELRAAVAAYLEMQNLEHENARFTKTRYYEDLAEKFHRKASAFEFRMQNISYVLSLMGRNWLTGLKPAKNVGAKNAALIEKFIAEIEGKQITPVVAFEIEVREQLERSDQLQPQGSLAPKTVVSSVTQFQRDASVKAWVLKAAKGICECCKKPAPFEGTGGLPYLEVHHIRKLAERGSDRPTNAVAVCPNCHRALHYGVNAKSLIESLYQSVSRLVRE